MKDNVKRKDFIEELEAMFPPARVQRAKKEAEEEIFRIRLSDLRKKMGVKQEDVNAFTQSGISKLEARKDMKISTLVEYLDNIGMGIEIKAYPKQKKKNFDEVVLLKK
ncbi:MAG: XRE family transcriptional regulator [Nitrospirae bacterium]|nr:XRE family transcriptional regulator [Nitrospirota bacterium]